MRISAKAEYACIAMLDLAVNHREPVPVRIKAIAEGHGISQGFLVQILQQLKVAGLVASTRGAAGGYQLGRPPEQISLADIVAAIDREPDRPEPVGGQSPAALAFRAAWQDVQAAEQRVLQALTLAEMVKRMQQTDALSYQI